jgi:hypothetical protein
MRGTNILTYVPVDDSDSDGDLDLSDGIGTPPLQEEERRTSFGRMYNLPPNPRKSARLISR